MTDPNPLPRRHITVLVHDCDTPGQIVAVVEVPHGTFEVTPIETEVEWTDPRRVPPDPTERYDVDIRAYRPADDRPEFISFRTGVESVTHDLIALAVTTGGPASEHDAVLAATIEGDVWAWLNYGYERGWCTRPCCDSHDGVPTTVEEDEEFDEGGDPCVPVVRLWSEGDKPPEAWT